MTVPAGDLGALRRAGRIVAIQTSVALAAVLLLVGVVIAGLYVRAQNNQINDQLNSVAMSTDDVDDPPPGMELVLRDNDGRVAVSDGGKAGLPLLSGPVGLHEIHDRDREYQALVTDRPEGRVVAMLDLSPFRAGRARLLSSLALAELAGIAASILVVVLFTRRSVRPLAQALALQRRFVADASHELRAPLTVLHTRAQLLAARLHSGNVDAAVKDADAMVADIAAQDARGRKLLVGTTNLDAGRPVVWDIGAIALSGGVAWPHGGPGGRIDDPCARRHAQRLHESGRRAHAGSARRAWPDHDASTARCWREPLGDDRGGWLAVAGVSARRLFTRPGLCHGPDVDLAGVDAQLLHQGMRLGLRAFGGGEAGHGVGHDVGARALQLVHGLGGDG